MTILSIRLGRALAAVLLACGILGAASVGQGLYSGLVSRAAAPAVPVAFGRLEEGDLVGRLSAPRVGLDTPVYEGIGSATLAQGPGHVPGTPLPGQDGFVNAVIAVAHSEEGNRVSRLRLGDFVEMRTPFGLRRYHVVQRLLLEPEAVHLEGSNKPRVTLLTPYPPEELGPAPMRLALSLEE